MTTENATPTPANDNTPKTTTRSRSTAKKDEVVALSVKEPAKLGLPNNRPIEPSHLKVMHTYRSVGGDRPVTAGLMEISSTMTVSGNRPIMASHLHISDSIVIMGNRPVAPNETDDMDTLIGYLD
ncbi:MAG: hypothetical protein VKJ86_01685 [Synechococcus sp.]|nr:hypothetical protein [Synechococcus sp.]